MDWAPLKISVTHASSLQLHLREISLHWSLSCTTAVPYCDPKATRFLHHDDLNSYCSCIFLVRGCSLFRCSYMLSQASVCRMSWDELLFCEDNELKCILQRKITSKWKLEELMSLETELIKFVNSSTIISLPHWWLAAECCQKVCHNVLRPVYFGRQGLDDEWNESPGEALMSSAHLDFFFLYILVKAPLQFSGKGDNHLLLSWRYLILSTMQNQITVRQACEIQGLDFSCMSLLSWHITDKIIQLCSCN